MDLKYLKLVKTIVEFGNISKSADHLFLTQSALSHQLREFEMRLGVKIFVRSRNNWKLTPEGKEIYELSRDVMTRLDDGLKKIGNIKEGSGGSIRLSTECYTFYHGLPSFIQKMGALYPEIEIILKIEYTHHPISQLLSNDLDICIVTTRPIHEQLIVHELSEDELFAIVHEEHELAAKEFLTPSDFANQNLIIHSLPLDTVSVYERFLKPNHIEPHKVTAIPMSEVALELVDANMGIACFPRWAIKSLKVSETLKFLPLGSRGLKRTHYLATRAEDQDKKYIRDFIDNFLEYNSLR